MDDQRADLRGSRFEYADLSGSVFRRVHLSDARFHGALLERVRMRGVEMVDVEVSGDVERLVVNGVDVAPYVEEQLLRDPAYAATKADDVAGLRAGWAATEEAWERTVVRARALPPADLHESVEDEWSFVQTLRHLAYATDVWIGRVLLGDPRPWHPLSLPFDGATPHPEMPWERDARPSLEEVLALRADRQATVRRALDGLTDDDLAGETTPVEGPSWPPARSFPVLTPFRVVLEEEYWHRRYAERDLTVLENRRSA